MKLNLYQCNLVYCSCWLTCLTSECVTCLTCLMYADTMIYADMEGREEREREERGSFTGAVKAKRNKRM
ncbi:hypothetical protein L1987_56531 [Smallanthus sonchifolius]|uniref:Uncharacterized protein n=1 Tax=Smallanthus sonchifolius TaxID=185202 RepID=A0ACB9ECQ8_9ASTR|nr:hypothetical protein L1987_56531 [Smallanthus sonchifolius]